MGLFGKVKKYTGADKVASVAARGVSAVGGYTERLAAGVKKEANTPGSEGSRFLHAPLGQYYLPKKVQSVGRALLPTPGGVISSYKKAYKESGTGSVSGTLKGSARAGLTTFDVLATPLLVSGIARAPKAVSVAGRGIAARVASQGGLAGVRAGEVGAVRATGKAATKGAQRAVAAEVLADSKAVKPAEFTIERAGGSISINGVPFSATMKTGDVPGLTKAIATSEGFVNAFSAVNRGKAAKMVFRAESAAARTGQPLRSGLTPATEATVNRAPLAERLGTETTAVAKEIKTPPKVTVPKSATNVRKPGPVTVRKATAAETSFGQKQTSALMHELEGNVAAAKTRTATAAIKAEASMPKVTVPKAAKTATAAAAEAAPKTVREAIREALKNPSRGAQSKLAKQFGISRQRVSELTRSELKKAAPAVAKGTTPAPKVAVPKAASAEAPEATAAVKAVKAAKTPAAEAAATPKSASIATRAVQGVVGHIPKKTVATLSVLGAGAVAVSQRGAGTAKTSDEAWTANLPDDLRDNVRALLKVKKERGERGLKALVTGLKATNASASNRTPEKRKKVLRAEVWRAYNINK